MSYRELVEGAPDAILVISRGKLLFANQAAADLVGLPDVGKIGERHLLDFTHPRSRERVTALVDTLSRERRSVSMMDVTVLRTDGSTREVEVTTRPIVYEGVPASVVFLRDITARKEAEEALRASEERYRRSEQRYQELINSSPNLIFSVDCSNRHTAANRACERMLGLEESQIIGRTIAELGVPAETARIMLAQLDETRETGRTRTREIAVKYPANGVRIIRRTTSPIYDDAGRVIGVSGLGIDITDQKASQETSEALLRAVEQLDEVMFTTDRQGAINYVNPAFERVYGYSRAEVLGKTPRILKSGELPLQFYQWFWSELVAGRPVQTEYRNRHKDGSLVDVIASVTPLLDNDGVIAGFVAVQQDITEQKRAREERQRLDERVAGVAKMEAIGTLAGGIAHDFNNILTIVQTHATLLERRQGDPDRVAAAAATLKQAVQRGASLSKQILTFARKAEIKLESVNAAGVVMELASMIAETFPRTIQVTLDLDADAPPIHADSGQLHQALLNLCVNARDAMPNGGTLTIGTQLLSHGLMQPRFADAQAANYLCISVTDNGTGMSEATRGHIFEPFFTTKEKGKGTGLGLAVVYGVVKSHGGIIDVESSPGRGTRFSLYFPVTSQLAARPAVERPAAAIGGTETLLVIEDEPAILMALEMQLQSGGYHVFTAADGPEGILVCSQVAPEIGAVIMDLGMPKMSAADLIHGLRAIVPEVPIIAMTGYVDPDVHAEVVRAGVRKIVQKPFQVDDMLRSLREVLNESALTPR